MLTAVILEGPMGKVFGRTWNLAVNSPAEALRMIDANKPGVFRWIKANLYRYNRYRVQVEYEDGRTDELDNETFPMQGKAKMIRFVPLVEGASAGVRFVVGALIYAVSFAYGFQPGMYIGASMMTGAVIEMLTPKPKMPDESERKDKTSYYFDGPVNTTTQGVPVPLIYGHNVRVGSHAISAEVSVDQLM